MKRTIRTMFVGLMALIFAASGTAGEPVAKGRKLSEWMKDLRSKDVAARKEAAEEIAGLGRVAASCAKDVARHLMQEKDAKIAQALAEALFRMGPSAPEAVEEIASALKVPHVAARRTIAQAFGEMGAAGKKALPALKETIEMAKQDTWAKRYAVRSYAEIAVAANDTSQLPYIVEVVSKHRISAMPVIGRFGDKAAGVVPTLMEVYAKHKGSPYARYCVMTFAMIGPAAKDALPQIREALKSEDPSERAAARIALPKIEAGKPPTEAAQ